MRIHRNFVVLFFAIATVGTVLLIVPATAANNLLSPAQQSVTDPLPNFVVLLVDDARVDDFDPAYMPATNALIGDQGARFNRFYSPFPLCCPARATLLTGQYAHNHGVVDNVPPSGFFAFDDAHTLGTWLDSNYQTGFVGKYLNGYGSPGMQTNYVPPGWD
ncbi:MAG TPA: sulfatase-like hydrolase/transferase, partial [Actinomycetes bacterium]|nr:sulfatase-like hydrolase/transferase [Actinomycetes bacterium]